MSEAQLDDRLSLELDCFLVCGLGSLGQHCVAALAEFRVKIIGIEQVSPRENLLKVGQPTPSRPYEFGDFDTFTPHNGGGRRAISSG